MPTYDYVCDACEHAFEHYQGINDDKLTKCPKCRKNKLRRLLGTGSAVVFKGSGFYQTDYRSESYKKAQAAEKPASSEGSSSGDSAKSESGGTTKNTDSKAPKSGTDSPSKSTKSKKKND